MFVHQSNRLESLARQLQIVIGTPLADPLAPEIIVVQNGGMAQWVARQVAVGTGLAAHLRFPLPARFAWELARQLEAAVPEEDRFAKPVLCWRIAGLLPGLLDHPACAELAAYLGNDADGNRLDQLSARIADVLDQYMVYRPDLLDRWHRGIDDHWQALLWRALTEGTLPHRARLGEQCRRLLSKDNDLPALLPQRCHLFGLNSLAPVYLDIVARLGAVTEVHLYHLSPCRHYWIDLAPVRQPGVRQAIDHPDEPVDAFPDPGHPLLASLGKIGRDFLRQLLEYDLQEIDLYQENEHHTLLATLQNDLLDLHDRAAAGSEPHPLAPDDRSVQFHCCFSPLREVQVLHDRLLDLFGYLPDLTPGDILVSAPDIGTYVEAVAGVFGEAGGERRIPWSIVDQSPASELPLIRCLLDLLALFTGRFAAPDVLAVCESPALLHRFDLDPAILPRLAGWIRETGIRWGLDEAHRRELEVEAGDLHSWRFGLDRLLLGYLMGDCRQPQADILPYGRLASGEGEVLGGFVALIEALAEWRRRLRGARPVVAWCGDLLHLADDLFSAEEDHQGLEILREAIIGLRTDCRLASHTEPVSLAVFTRHLLARLGQPTGGQPFQSGRVTFCNMVPMRSVPFRVVCLLGMDDGAFPRSQHPLAFDLMAAKPRPGDRNRNQDDRYLFLEALLSARDVFYISWVGRSQRDETALPPSVVVAELREYLDQSCLSAGSPAVAHLTTDHPMQPFSRRCFDGTVATASFNPAWLPATRQTDPPPFLHGGLGPPPDQWRSVDIDELCRFWRHPARYFLERVLGLRLWTRPTDLADSEPFRLDRLDQFHLRQATVAGLLAGRSADSIRRELTGSGVLPRNGFGRIAFDDIAKTSTQFADLLRPLLVAPLEPQPIDRTFGPFRLTGRLTDRYPAGRITWRAAVLKGADLMDLWVHHLIVHLRAPIGPPPVSVHLAHDPAGMEAGVQRVTLRPVVDAAAEVQRLLDLYWQGLSAPLPFFPETSRAWAEASGQGKDPHEAARRTWEDSFQRDGEGQHPAYRLCFPQERFVADPAFIDLADLYLPILAHLEVDRADP